MIKDNECLAFGFQVLLGNDIYNIAELGEYRSKCFCQWLELDSLFKILHVYTATWSVYGPT